MVDEINKKIILNNTNPLFNVIYNGHIHLGPEWYHLTPYLIRVVTQINPECKEMDLKDLYKYQDRLLELDVLEHKDGIDGLKGFEGFDKDI